MYVASIITILRLIGAFLLLLTAPLSISFLVLYALCCISDVLDGYIARKTKTTSKLGEILDSIADFILVVVMLVIFIPLFEWKQWMLYWISIVALIRFLSLVIGYIKYRKLSFLHTYANKVTGIVLAFFPIWYQLFGLGVQFLFYVE